jgi:demethylmenaquinone methyltransferase/2-methoxy-6-polyprenyl-1,4-benzoquinol methylase
LVQRLENVNLPNLKRTATPDPAKSARIRRMFAAIVPRYDLVNTLMTMGLDRRWRRLTVATAGVRGAVTLDIATGTGELAFEMARQGASSVVAADFCPEMLIATARKMSSSFEYDQIKLLCADAMRLPFPDATFDCIVNGFMLRNVADLSTVFSELLRVLKPEGRLVCLDLTPPRGGLRRFFSLYIGAIVPLLGVAVARNYGAYRYLYQSLSVHPDADQVAAMLRAAGFHHASYKLVGCGTVAIHLARKGSLSEPQAFAVV